MLDLPIEDAHAVQRDYYQRYGTTLRGLMEEKGVQPDDFLDYVHDVDHSVLEPNPALADAIDRLPGKKFVFTNGSRGHAERSIARLGLTSHFTDLLDIVATDLVPKPRREAYDMFLAKTGVSPVRAAMFEDLSRNLAVPHLLGMHTILVVPPGTREVFREAWELEGDDAPHVEFVTDDLAGFIEKVAGAIES
ncbi:pyrimidine 5'-nucleotidase [Methylobrevis pamukkalensis]|uniref:Pyrimidine 5'-nucleotidase n=1 Tax=Methylobrevis pamukkalensis TaxID=1439726 RepID=A0A1E3H1Z8_9HYPH|nr:hypothetical protein A6302_02499 [Methylobrevis pamukkalensis]